MRRENEKWLRVRRGIVNYIGGDLGEREKERYKEEESMTKGGKR